MVMELMMRMMPFLMIHGEIEPEPEGDRDGDGVNDADDAFPDDPNFTEPEPELG